MVKGKLCNTWILFIQYNFSSSGNPQYWRSRRSAVPCERPSVAYPLLPVPWLMKAYPGPQLPKELENFTDRLADVRKVIEICFGRCKARWRCLLKRNDSCIDNLIDIAWVFVLHTQQYLWNFPWWVWSGMAQWPRYGGESSQTSPAKCWRTATKWTKGQS